jgi:hypothetical protein
MTVEAKSLDDTRATHCPKMSPLEAVFAYDISLYGSNHQNSGPPTISHPQRHRKGEESYLHIIKGVFVLSFSLIFGLAFGISKNWMDSKARSWKHISMSFSASRFWCHLAFGSPEN